MIQLIISQINKMKRLREEDTNTYQDNQTVKIHRVEQSNCLYTDQFPSYQYLEQYYSKCQFCRNDASTNRYREIYKKRFWREI